MFKTQVEPRATGRRVVSLQSFERLISMVYGLWCRPWKIVVDLFFTTSCIFSFLRSFSENVTSFPWSVVSWTIALDQSAREDSRSYCKTILSDLGEF